MSTNSAGYYRRDRDVLLWGAFDKLADDKRMSVSALITEAAREYVERHKDDPPLPLEVKPNRHALDVPDPFEAHNAALRTDQAFSAVPEEAP